MKIQYDFSNYAGPVAKAYETTSLDKCVIIGPTGGGKTISSIRRILQVARSQYPSKKDGVRKSKIVCLGPTYRDLWDKAIPSYFEVFSKDMGKWSGGRGDPATHTMEFVLHEPQPNGTIIKKPLLIEVWFRAKSADETIENFMRGLTCTGWWFQEMDQINPTIVEIAPNRVGRYLPTDELYEDHEYQAMGFPRPIQGLWGDTNMPTVGSWLHKDAFVDKKYGAGLFVQPPALLDDNRTNPKAENLHNLRKIRPDYYENMAKIMSEYDVDKLLKLKPCYDRRGKPVHPLFKASRHEAGGLQFDPNLPLIIGADTGNTLKNAAVFVQPHRSGLHCLAEISPMDRQTTIDDFAREITQMLNTRFRGARDITLVVDPAAQATININMHVAAGKLSYARYLQGLTGLDTILAETNDPNQRIAAGDYYLEREGGFFIDPQTCPHTCAALSGGYAFRKIGDANTISVMKNDYSHLGEAWQYACLLARGGILGHEMGMKNNFGSGGGYDPQPTF